MKIIKWIVGIIVVILIIVLTLFCFKKIHIQNEPTISIWELDEYKGLELDDIQEINIISYTEGGSESVLQESRDEIEKTYNSLSKIQVGKETDMACEDNTTIYSMKLKTGEEVNVEIECDWIVIHNKRYLIVK